MNNPTPFCKTLIPNGFNKRQLLVWGNDDFVNSLKMPYFVIPAKAGIQYF
jgi:hypothetical protein